MVEKSRFSRTKKTPGNNGKNVTPQKRRRVIRYYFDQGEGGLTKKRWRKGRISSNSQKGKKEEALVLSKEKIT